MIIREKSFPNYRKFEMMFEGRPLSFEVGKMAELCNASVLVKYGETSVLVTCTASARPKDGIDYFPLAVDFNEKLLTLFGNSNPGNLPLAALVLMSTSVIFSILLFRI